MTDYTRKINELAMKDCKPDHVIVQETPEQTKYRQQYEKMEDYWKCLNNEYGT